MVLNQLLLTVSIGLVGCPCYHVSQRQTQCAVVSLVGSSESVKPFAVALLWVVRTRELIQLLGRMGGLLSTGYFVRGVMSFLPHCLCVVGLL